MEVESIEGLMDDCQQLAAYYEDAFWERGEWGEEDLEFLKESLDFLADRYASLIFLIETAVG